MFDDNMSFILDESDLDEAIRSQLSEVKKEDKTGDDNDAPGERQNQQKAASESDYEYEERQKLEKFFEDQYKKEVSQQDDEEEYDEDDGDDEQSPQPKKVEKQEQSKDEEEDNTPLTYQDILDIIKEERLLYIPDDFDGELDADTIDYFKEQTRLQQRNEIINELRSLYAEDPNKLRTFDYFIMGGKDADMPKYQALTESSKRFDSLDITKEENQREILRMFLREGLDESNPAHRLRLSKIEDDVDEIIGAYEGEDRTKEAIQYFKEKDEKLLRQEEQRIMEIKKAEALAEQEQRQRELMWHQQFQKSLQDKAWSETKKRQIMEEQYGEVAMQDGSYVPVWFAKEMMIKQNPELYQVYLDWLNTSFDLYAGKFVEREDAATLANRKILEMAKKKSTNRTSSGEVNKRKKPAQDSGVVNPLDNI